MKFYTRIDPKTRLFIKSASLLFTLYVLWAFLKFLLIQQFPQIRVSEYTQSNLFEMLANNPFKAFVMVLVIAPVLEEIMFRTLLKPSHIDFVLFIVAWPTYYIAYYVIPPDVNWFMRLVFIAVFLGSFTYIGIQLLTPLKGRHLRAWLSRHYIKVWLITSSVFALLHINNYVDTFMINLPLIMLVIPRFLAGLFFGYIKIKNKHLSWSIGMHMLNNAIPISILLITH
ncbi:CPBP family glutamic-type intramembrane protease [Leeuwenhoekiella sp. W20_SRS_FM14]|uniref:CPBP family glutamic-type intramembrane protease n=1 Tax=Leeuwenhoekiella sp. W20_SRS_FM14 TaxID=3240270 RepID=UPI003F9486F9